MAEGPDPFVKLEEQVKCPVCIDIFTTPKLLGCNHALCKDCIDHLPVDVDKGHHIVKCPTCRKPTTLPQDDAANLPPAFHINTLIEVHHAAQIITATVSGQPKADSKYTRCSIHDQSLEMYCEDCSELACTKCFHHEHEEHTGDNVTDVFDKHQEEISDNLVAVEQCVDAIFHALENLTTQEREIVKHGESVKDEINTFIHGTIRLVKQSGRHLREQVDELTKQKLHQIAKQKEDGKEFIKELKSVMEYVQDKLRNGSQKEILLEKNEMIERLKYIDQELMLQQLQLRETADIVFEHSHDILEKCSKLSIGQVGIKCTSIDKLALSIGSPIIKPTSKVAILGRHRNIDINVPNISRLKRRSLSCQLVSNETGAVTKCKIRHIEKETYRASFTPTHPGRHRAMVQVKGANACNPFNIQVLSSPKTKCQQVRMVEAAHMPQGIAITPYGLLFIIETNNTDILVANRHGSVIERFQHQGGGYPREVCISPNNYILVVGEHGPHIAMYTMSHALVAKAKSSYGNGPLQFNRPQGIAVSGSGHVYVCDTGNHCIQVLTPDLLFYHKFGKEGSGPGQFYSPCSIAIDSGGMLYVCDRENNRIQKLSSYGMYISEFNTQSKPNKIAIDYNDIMYIACDDEISIYDSNGDYFGCVDSVMAHELAVDKQGHIYTCQDDRISIYESICSLT